jgi:hypothetical protein
MRPAIVIPALVALALIWAGVAVVMTWTEEYVSSPEKVGLMISQRPWKGGKQIPSSDRKLFLDRLTKYYNLLDPKQKQQLREQDTDGVGLVFLSELTEPERKDYLRVMIEAQMQPLMKAWQRMSKDDRRRYLTSSRSEMRKSGRDTGSLDALAEDDAKVFDKLIDGDLKAYYDGSDDMKKLNLLPLMEEMQARVQGGRRR